MSFVKGRAMSFESEILKIDSHHLRKKPGFCSTRSLSNITAAKMFKITSPPTPPFQMGTLT